MTLFNIGDEVECIQNFDGAVVGDRFIITHILTDEEGLMANYHYASYFSHRENGGQVS